MEILHGKSAVLASFHNETIIGARYLKMLQEDDLPVLQTIKAFNQSQFVCQKDGVLPHGVLLQTDVGMAEHPFRRSMDRSLWYNHVTTSKPVLDPFRLLSIDVGQYER